MIVAVVQRRQRKVMHVQSCCVANINRSRCRRRRRWLSSQLLRSRHGNVTSHFSSLLAIFMMTSFDCNYRNSFQFVEISVTIVLVDIS